jgi:hypothetical protein
MPMGDAIRAVVAISRVHEDGTATMVAWELTLPAAAAEEVRLSSRHGEPIHAMVPVTALQALEDTPGYVTDEYESRGGDSTDA